MLDATSPTDEAALSTPSRKFLSLATDYVITEGSDSTGLMDDASLFLEYAHEAVSTIANGLEDKGSDIAINPQSAAIVLRGVLRFIEMAASNVGAVNGRLTAASVS